MPRSPHRRASSLLVLLTGLSLLILGLVGAPRAAFAHAELLSTEPAAGAVLDRPPTQVVLTFSEGVDISPGAIRLFDGTGTRLEIPEATRSGAGDSVVSVALPDLPAGSYVVSWRAVSADSHPVSAAFVFQVGAASTLGSDVLATIERSSSSNASAKQLLGFSRTLVIAAVALVGGIFAAMALGVVAPDRRQLLALRTASVTGALAGLASVPLEAAFASGRSIASAAADSSAWNAVLDTRSGTAWVIRAALLLLGGLGLAALSGRHRSGTWRVTAAALLLALATASAYGGHGATGRWTGLGVVLTVAHVVAMAVWIGGLVALALAGSSLTAAGARRFSGVALASVGVVVLTGTLQGVRQLGSFGALFDNDYGRLLTAKVVSVAIIIGFAAISRAAVRRKHDGAEGFDRAALGRSVRAEVLFSAAVVILTASLMGANPHAAGSLAPFSASLVSDDYIASVTVDPPAVGLDALHIYLSSPGGSLAHPDSLSVTIADAERDVAPIEIAMVAAGANHYQATAAQFPYAATWTLTIRAVYNTFDEVVFTTEVEIR